MSHKKKIKSDYDFEQSIWKESGPEQKQLDEMFSNGLIDDNTSPKDIRENNPEFKKYSAQVFNAHFRKTKNKIGKNIREIVVTFYIIIFLFF